MEERQRILAANLSRRNRGGNLERDKRRQKVAIAIAAVVVLLVIAIPVYGWVTTFVLPPREVIVRVNDVEYDMGYLVKLMRMVQRTTEAGGQQVNLGTVPFQMVQDLATNELVVQGAQAEGLNVSEEELDAEVRLRILGAVGDTATTPGELETEFQESYRQFLNQVQLTDNEYRDIVERDLYRILLEEHLGDTIPRQQEQVHLYALAAQSSEDVEELKTKFERGSTFAELVDEYPHTDPETLRRGGEIDWVPRGVLEEHIRDYIFDELPDGELSDGIPDFDLNTGAELFVIYYVPEREESRELSDGNFEELRRLLVADWVVEQRRIQDVVTDFDSTQYAWLAKKLRLTTTIPTR